MFKKMMLSVFVLVSVSTQTTCMDCRSLFSLEEQEEVFGVSEGLRGVRREVSKFVPRLTRIQMSVLICSLTCLSMADADFTSEDLSGLCFTKCFDIITDETSDYFVSVYPDSNIDDLTEDLEDALRTIVAACSYICS